MLTPLALFLGLLAATAFIAHWSDNLGKKLGKKRVSVFGLRPRTSATILTVVSSWGIMALTLVALLLAVAPLRIALFSYEQQLTSFEGKIKASQQQLQQVESQRQKAQAQAREFQSVAEKKQNDATRAGLAATKAQEDATKAQGDTAKAKADFNRAKVALNRAQSAEQSAAKAEQKARQGESAAQKSAHTAQLQAVAAQRDFQQANSQLQTKQGQVKAAQRQLSFSQRQLSASQHQLNQSRNQLNLSKQQLVASQKDLGANQKRLAKSYKDIAKSYKDVAQAYKQVAEVQQKVSRLQTQAKTLQTQVKTLESRVQFLTLAANQNGQIASRLLFRPIVLRADETLSERRIDANPSAAQVERELRILLDGAQRAATQYVRGSKLVACALVPKSEERDAEIVILNEKDTIENAARLLALTNEPVSARLVSVSNYPDDAAEILARFVFVPVRTIYAAQQTIGEATVDATKSESAIFGQLQKLVEAARANAVQRGSSPPLSRDDTFFDGDTGQKMFDTLRQLQRLGHPVPVRVVAARDLDATEPLQIRFQIGPPNAARNTT